MDDHMFEEEFVNIGGKRQYTLLVSTLAHTPAIARAIIVPLIATANNLGQPGRHRDYGDG